MNHRAPLAFALFAGLTLTTACATASSPAIETVGEPLRVNETTPIADILAQPASYEGQRVRIEGEVTGVCAAMGCWMDVADPAGRTLQVKVDDGVLVFPQEALGGHGKVEGTVEMLPMERDAYIAHMSHMAEDAGEEFDEASVGDGPYEVVRLRGLGAEIEIPTAASTEG
jgi:hypothetical protein